MKDLPGMLTTRDVLPFNLVVRNARYSAEQLLLQALLMDAYKTITRGTDRGQSVKTASLARADALLWVEGKIPRARITFRTCCEGLGIDEGQTRGVFLKAKAIDARAQ